MGVISIKKIIFVFSIGLIICIIPIIISCLITLNFFCANVVDEYVEDNAEYGDIYEEVLNKNIKKGNGYVSLSRILYFYLEDDNLTFEEIYIDNLDTVNKRQKPISEICNMDKYSSMDCCSEDSILESGQIDEEQNKPFNAPLEISNMNVTSFFMKQRVVYGKSSVHKGWDFSSNDRTPVYSVCDGVVSSVSFPYISNTINKSGGGGNQIKIKCDVDENINYDVIYMHLYPNSSKVKVGDVVNHWTQIAEVGTTGYSTGSHLHFQVQTDDGKNIDGVSLIDFTKDE